ncbi:MAG: serine/threonine protein kinase [Pirellulales bacterium]|nr:serine/threonine protein kinase [Pirellulales bacterium]
MCDPTVPFRLDDDETVPEVPDFELIRPIGQGGFGRVWLATNRTTGHLRAVKVISLRRRGTTDPAGREITSITRLEANLRRQHANLLTIHHVGQTAEHLFYVMDLADDATGRPASPDADYRAATLLNRLGDGPLPVNDCLRCARQLLAGLASLHEAGMVHRDVKPANCLFVDGQLKLADFGLLTEANPQISRVGTQKYMPPDGRMDARADVYAAGLAIYEMVTGLPADSFPRLGERAADVAADPTLCLLVRLALGACQPDPQQRFADADAMLREIAEPRKPAAESHGRRRWIAVSIAALAAAAALAAVCFWPGNPPRVQVNFITEPYEATILLDGVRQLRPDGTPCTTPCTIENVSAETHRVIFQHQGLPDLDAGRIDFAATRQIRAEFTPRLAR